MVFIESAKSDTNAPSVAAVVVTYHPQSDVFDNLLYLCDEFVSIFVVDNGSGEESLVLLREICTHKGMKLIENGKNLGIAAALNKGVRVAALDGHSFVFFFDQDSRISPGFVEAMMNCYRAIGHHERVGILMPLYYDSRVSNVVRPNVWEEQTRLAMTSGSMTSISVFREQGLFIEDFFIDYVDYEFSLRVLSAGYSIRECVDATLYHSPGDPRSYAWMGIKIVSASYSAFRRYYIERNMVWMLRIYAAKFPSLCFKMLLNSLKDGMKILLVEPEKRKKLSSSLRGVLDGCLTTPQRKWELS